MGEGSVKDVRDVVTASRNLAYTTVMTVLDRLARRGAVERRKMGRRFVYLPKLDREHARRLALKELVDTYFGGSEEALLEYLRPGSASALARSGAATGGMDPSLL
jgi:predicted transcriptional regulator